MKAAIYKQYGPPSVVSIQEVPKPEPKPNEVLIKIHASSVNRTDCGFRSAEYFVSRFFSGLFRPKLPILGNEFAGTVEAIGADVSLYKIGDKVFGYNDAKFGTHAEYVTYPQDAAMAFIPDDFTFEQAAVSTEGAHYALCDIRAAKVKPGDIVMVHGATGAIGSAAVQLLKHFGAYVVAVCNTKNVDLVKSLGADVVIDYMTQDYTQTDLKFDFVFDAVGKSSFRIMKALLKPKGIYISTELGKRGANVYLALLAPILGDKKVLFPLPVIKKSDIELLAELAASGKFKPVIDRTYALAQIVEAYEYAETGQKTGNLVLKVAE